MDSACLRDCLLYPLVQVSVAHLGEKKNLRQLVKLHHPPLDSPVMVRGESAREELTGAIQVKGCCNSSFSTFAVQFRLYPCAQECRRYLNV